MQTLMSVLLAITGIVSLVCWIIILVKIFKENVGLGILGIICGLFAFVYGWVKVKEYQAMNIMVIWTIAIVISLIAQALGGAALARGIMEQSQGAAM
jgi:hypothetical protein